jgi:hypothetical protein
VPAAAKPFTLVLLYGTTVSRHARFLSEMPPVISGIMESKSFLTGQRGTVS